MKNQKHPAGFTQIKRVGQALPDNAPAKGHLAAFTLIELLVVVLIIGILAAVAIPQYKLAVTKSRVSTVLPMLKSIADAEETYYLTNGTYTEDMRDLDVDMPGHCQATPLNNREDLFHCDNYFLFDLEAKSNQAVVIAHYCPDNNTSWEICKPKREFSIRFFLQHSALEPNVRACRVDSNSVLGNKICNSLASFKRTDEQ